VPYSGGNGVTYSGFVNGEDASVLSGTLAWGGNSQGAVDIGTYVMIPSNLTSANYAIDYSSATLTINKAPITVTANREFKFIGARDPPLTYDVTRGTLFGGDSLSGTLSRAAGDLPGAYPITRGTLASSNYAITFVGSTLFIEVNPATIFAPSTVSPGANDVLASPVSSLGSTAPSAAGSGNVGANVGGLLGAATNTTGAVNTNLPRPEIVTFRDGKIIISEPGARAPR
jgi:MBG domain (YGX type)